LYGCGIISGEGSLFKKLSNGRKIGCRQLRNQLALWAAFAALSPPT